MNQQEPNPETPEFDAAGTEENALQTELESLRGELEQLKAQSLLERADLENQRKRMARDIEQARKFANERLLSELLPLFDAMDAGLAAAPADDPLRAGLELTLKQLHKIAENNGLSEISPATGDAFDAERHHAVSAVDNAEVPPGAVLQVFQKGYALNDRLLRPALVVVARQD